MLKKKRLKKIKEECWNLDYHLVVWLNEHLKVYNEDNNVDTYYEEFNYKGKKITFQEVLDRLIDITDWLLTCSAYDYMRDVEQNNGNVKEINSKKDEMYDLLKLVHWQLWW